MPEQAISHRRGPGGTSAYVGRSRVRVSDIAQYYQVFARELQTASHEPIVGRIYQAIPHLSPSEIEAALDYWHEHRSEIDEEIVEEQRLAREITDKV